MSFVKLFIFLAKDLAFLFFALCFMQYFINVENSKFHLFSSMSNLVSLMSIKVRYLFCILIVEKYRDRKHSLICLTPLHSIRCSLSIVIDLCSTESFVNYASDVMAYLSFWHNLCSMPGLIDFIKVLLCQAIIQELLFSSLYLSLAVFRSEYFDQIFWMMKFHSFSFCHLSTNLRLAFI